VLRPVALTVVAVAALAGCGGPYRDAATRIAEATAHDDGAWTKLATLTDTIGARPAGSPALEKAVAWARDTFLTDGLENVRLEPVRVPHWVRGAESAALLTPVRRPLAVLGLGGGVPTPPDGITAEVLAVPTFEALDALGPKVAGKIVLYTHAMPTTGHPGHNYGAGIMFRTKGATRAAARGAVAVLVRSLTANSLGAPHTGRVTYPDDGSVRIPAAAISVEDATLLARLAARGPVTVHLALDSQTLPDADSANVVAELRGRERPDEIVVISAHLDSWDVGQGAQDDGAGVAIVMQALATLRRLGLQPRRTIRAVLFTDEEARGSGGKAYAATHAAELPQHVAAFETDTGPGRPLGFMTDGPQPWLGEARKAARALEPWKAHAVVPGFPGEDVMKLKPAGVPLLGLMVDMSHYFDVHHSAADTLEKIDPQNLQRNVAALATMAFIVADQPARWQSKP
jgi:Zn-dependent M28 family amino/carboxypeptidase